MEEPELFLSESGVADNLNGLIDALKEDREEIKKHIAQEQAKDCPNLKKLQRLGSYLSLCVKLTRLLEETKTKILDLVGQYR